MVAHECDNSGKSLSSKIIHDRPLVFVTGVPRSGTTLISMILNGHSQVCITPETHYFDKFYRKGERRNCLEDDASFTHFVRYFIESPNLDGFHLSEAERTSLYNNILAGDVRSHEIVLGTLLAYYGQQHGKHIVGEKTPKHIFYSEEILALFPHARILHVVRDPRDVVLSLKAVRWERGNMLEHLALWRQAVQKAQRLQRKFPERFMVVKYEDVLRDPEGNARRLCAFLKILYESEMLTYHEHTQPNFDVRAEPWKAKNLQALDSTNMMKWKKHMPRKDRVIVEDVAEAEMSELNYPLEHHVRDWGVRFRFGYLVIQNRILRGWHRMKGFWLRLRESNQGRR